MRRFFVIFTHMTEQEAQKNIFRKRTTEGFMSIRWKTYCYFERVEMKRQKKFRKKHIKKDVETFSFLQYIRIMYDWAKGRYGLSRDQIDLLIYLHPLGLFTKTELKEAMKIYPSAMSTFTGVFNKGFIFEYDRYQDKDLKVEVVYALSNTAKSMINKFYGLVIGEEQFSTSPTQLWMINKVGTQKTKYDDILLQFNKKIKDKDASK